MRIILFDIKYQEENIFIYYGKYYIIWKYSEDKKNILRFNYNRIYFYNKYHNDYKHSRLYYTSG